MATYPDIRKLYQPVQPTIRASDQSVYYREYAPAADLENLIYCYWELRTKEALTDAFHYRVVADGCIDLLFEMQDSKAAYLIGFSNKYTEFQLANRFHYVGVRFLPTAFSQLFQIRAADLTNRLEEMGAVLPKAAKALEESIELGQTMEEWRVLFDTYFLQILSQTKFKTDARLYEAIAIILERRGVLNIQKDLDTGLSSRQLRRLFQFYIGDSPKTFSKVIRFQNILRAKPSVQSLRKDKLFFDAGYYDQAHFIKDFNNLYGLSPSKAFDRKS